MYDAKELLSKLKSTEPERQQEKIISQLNKFICAINEDDVVIDSLDVLEVILHHDAMNLVLSHLRGEVSEENEQLLVSCAQLIAELAKAESLRESLVNTGVIPHLLRHLSSKHIALATQACRALGNICYDNDAGRIAVDKEDGISVVLGVLSKQTANTEEGASRLRVIVCGFLLNLTNNCEILQERALEKNVLDRLNECVTRHIQDEDLINMALLTTGSITESDEGKVAAVKAGLLDTLKKLIDIHHGGHLVELIIDLLSSLLESELAKDRAADNGLCESLVRMVEADSNNQELIKLASDVLVSILVGDTSMEKLYASGEGSLFLQSLEWLSSEKECLKTLGTLAIGNFARRDAYCQHLVEKGVVSRLISMLKSTSGQESCFTLEHAILSSLRNLAIPVVNKPRLLQAGVMEACLSLINTEVMAVIFKLLGVLRMLIEGQEAAAIKLGQERAFLERLIEWCGVEAHAGVKGEATRVMASLVKNSRSTVVIQNIIRGDGLSHLITMTMSEHLVMQNEAIVALIIICSMALGEAAIPLKEVGLTDTILTLLRDKNLPAEMLCNVLSLLSAISTAGNLQEEILTSGIVDLVRSLCESPADEKIKVAARSTLTLLEESMSCT
ncbi:unnamed protein product [Candidula unifasciata]|uniref:Uncharacterized protein n=1 Tax=Candidula unifasciata TaxID=100452 RepID=A0A8S3ZU28_9EUPU|nr:unnamed protein product [Candidula unifasciata]